MNSMFISQVCQEILFLNGINLVAMKCQTGRAGVRGAQHEERKGSTEKSNSSLKFLYAVTCLRVSLLKKKGK